MSGKVGTCEHIARISYGKDSLKMLEVIHSRGLPLDRITTTDVWATDTISANLPSMDAFKERMDQRIWDMYRIEVEHLCARNKDGSKKTYEQMFYHVPVRRSQSVQVEREREQPSGPVSQSAMRTGRSFTVWQNWPNEPDVGRVAYGVPNRVDRLKCLGNAVVPQQFYPFFRWIADLESGCEKEVTQ